MVADEAEKMMVHVRDIKPGEYFKSYYNYYIMTDKHNWPFICAVNLKTGKVVEFFEYTEVHPVIVMVKTQE